VPLPQNPADGRAHHDGRGRPPMIIMSDAVRFVVAVAVAVFRGGRVLAMRRSPQKDAAAGAWETLSGRVLPGEQPVQAAHRETLEECGLEVTLDPRPVASYQAKRNRDDMIIVVYRGVSDAGDVVPSDEHDAFAWMTPDEFARVCPFPQLIEAVRLAGETARGGAA